MAKELTNKIKAELSGKPVRERRKALTNFHKTGYNIKQYLEEMLTSSNGTLCGPEGNGFKRTTFGGSNLLLYKLSDEETIFFYQQFPDGKYEPWPG